MAWRTHRKLRAFARLRRLRRAQAGVAMIEFALVAPLMLLLIVSALELASFGLAHLRVSQIAMTVSDNAGRVMTGIDEANIYEVFAGADVIGRPIDFEARGRIVLSSLEHNGRNGGNEGQFIRWQRCWGELEVDPAYGVEGDGRTDDELEDGMGQDGNRIASLPGTAVMFVEVNYVYEPLIAGDVIGSRQIRYESAFNVRGRENQVISNASGLAALTCA